MEKRNWIKESFEFLREAMNKGSRIFSSYFDEYSQFIINGEIKGAVQIEEVEQMLKAKQYNLLTDDKLQIRLGGTSYQKDNYPLGETLAKLAYQKLKSEECKWQELKPLYIQPPPMG